jgi:hypothetical protein
VISAKTMSVMERMAAIPIRLVEGEARTSMYSASTIQRTNPASLRELALKVAYKGKKATAKPVSHAARVP